MILPNKHITQKSSLLGIGGIILQYLNRPSTVSNLWDKVHEIPEISTFRRFVMGLDLLYMIGVIEIVDGVIRKKRS